jgi:hypothetical protein
MRGDNLKVIFSEGLKTNLPSSANNGVFFYCTDTQQLYRSHSDNSLKEISNIIIIDTEELRQNITNPVTSKFYFVISTKIMYFYTGSQWIELTVSMNDYYDKLEVEQLIVDYVGNLSVLKTTEKGTLVGAINECFDKIDIMNGGEF